MRVKGQGRYLARAAAVILHRFIANAVSSRITEIGNKEWKKKNKIQGTMADMHAVPSLSSSYLWQRRANSKLAFAPFLVFLFVWVHCSLVMWFSGVNDRVRERESQRWWRMSERGFWWVGARSSSASFFFLLSFFCLFVLLSSASHTQINKQNNNTNKQRETTTSTKRPWSDHALLFPSLCLAPFSPRHHLTDSQLLPRLIIYYSVSRIKRHMGLVHGLRRERMKSG